MFIPVPLYCRVWVLCVPEGVRKPLDRPLATGSGPLLCSGSGCTAACKYKCIVENSDRLTSPHTYTHTLSHTRGMVGGLSWILPRGRSHGMHQAVNSSAHWLFIHFKCSDIADLWVFYLEKKGAMTKTHGMVALSLFQAGPGRAGPGRFWSVLAVRSARRLHLAGFLETMQLQSGHQ